jgi:RNA polymerase sigma factor (sigma-70 family)
MVDSAAHPVLRFIHSITLSCADSRVLDEDLINRFATHHDDDAFAEMVRRHGPMVLGVCARVLGDTPDAEDAFQTTFLVLARRACSMSRPGLLANWLYGVAYRTALKARAGVARRSAAERQVSIVSGSDPLDELIQCSLRLVLDEELSRLPEKYRVPIVLCYLDGQTHDEVARRLGCPRKTVTTRLTRGCERLRARLTRRGFALPSVALVVPLLDSARAIPAVLMETTIWAATTGTVPAGISALVKEVIMSMFICKLKWVGLLVLTLCALGAPAIALTHPATGERPEKKKPAAVRQALPQQAAAIDAAQEDSEALQGGWEGQSAEQDGKSLPDEEVKKLRVSIKGDRMMIIPGGEWTPLKFKLDPTKSPKVLRMAPGEGPEKDKVVPVIYRLNKDADMLTLCWDAKEGKAVPEDFSSKKGSGLMLVVLKHERPLTTPAAVKE